MNELQLRMLDWMIAVLLPDVELETEEGMQAFENALHDLVCSPGFEEKFGRDVPDELVNTVLDLEFEVYQERATIVYNKQLIQEDDRTCEYYLLLSHTLGDLSEAVIPKEELAYAVAALREIADDLEAGRYKSTRTTNQPKENDMGNIRTALEYLKSILKMTNNGTDLSAQSEGDLKMAIQILEDVLQKNRGGDQ